MKEALIWKQGGQTNVLMSKTILFINEVQSENPNVKGGCDISVDYLDEPISCSLPIQEVLRLLEINEE